MKEVIRNNFGAIVFSIAIHAILLVLLIFSFDFQPERKSLVVKQNVIKAVAVDASKVQAELEKLKRADDRNKKKEKDRIANLKREENKLRKKRAAEEKKLAELKEKRQSEEKQRKLEQKNLAELKKKRQAEEQQRKLEQKNLAELKKQQAALKKKQQAETEKRKAEELRQAELKKKQDAIKKQQALEKKKREADKKQRQKELAQQLAAEEQAQADELAKREIDKYQVLIRQKIERNWLKPSELKNLRSVVAVRLIPGGEVIDASISTTSGNLIFDRSAEQAVRKASPLPLPKNLAIAAKLYNFNFLFKAE